MKQEFKDLLSRDLKINSLSISSKIFDIGRSAESIAKLAQQRVDEDGDYAKIHCSNIIDWMNDIVEQAQKALDLHLQENKLSK